jgi:flagellar hook-associated protein 3 FlgL
MRISTNTIFDTASAKIGDLQFGVNKTNQQLSANRRILSPSDDPIASARALVVTQSDAVNEQYAINRRNGKNSLSATENVLSNVTNALHDIKTLIVSAGNGSLTDADRGFYATELQGHLDRMLSLANSTDETGNYLFSGYANTTAPYVKTISGATYVGDQGQRFIQADTSRQIAVGDIGPAIFENIRTSSTAFSLGANTANLGKAVISGGTVGNPALLTGNNYEIKFSSAISFDVLNVSTGLPVLAAQPYVSGQLITIDGIDVNITDTPTGPNSGDTFSIDPGSQNVFEALTGLLSALKTPIATAADRTSLASRLGQANKSMDQSLSNVLASRSGIGNSLKEIDTLDSAGEGVGLVYKQELSELQDVDYVKAFSDLVQQKFVLEAAQQSFVKTASLSLFNYIS